jgi:hypothetical protein
MPYISSSAFKRAEYGSAAMRPTLLLTLSMVLGIWGRVPIAPVTT